MNNCKIEIVGQLVSCGRSITEGVPTDEVAIQVRSAPPGNHRWVGMSLKLPVGQLGGEVPVGGVVLASIHLRLEGYGEGPGFEEPEEQSALDTGDKIDKLKRELERARRDLERVGPSLRDSSKRIQLALLVLKPTDDDDHPDRGWAIDRAIRILEGLCKPDLEEPIAVGDEVYPLSGYALVIAELAERIYCARRRCDLVPDQFASPEAEYGAGRLEHVLQLRDGILRDLEGDLPPRLYTNPEPLTAQSQVVVPPDVAKDLVDRITKARAACHHMIAHYDPPAANAADEVLELLAGPLPVIDPPKPAAETIVLRPELALARGVAPPPGEPPGVAPAPPPAPG